MVSTHRIRSAALIAIALIAQQLNAQSSRALAGLPAVDSIAAAEFARDSLASITIGVVTGEGLVWTKSYGFAEMASRRVASRSSVYRIGSITKMFTALMLHQLIGAGKIQLSDPVERFYPEIREVRGYKELKAPITVLQLATMTGGLAREPKEEGPFWTGPVAHWDSVVHLALPHTDIAYQPGTRFMYSNIGYAILGATLARVAAVPFIRWERERIFDPLGMKHTSFEIDASIANDVALGYDIGDDGKADGTVAAREGREGRGYKVPNGAMFTTVDDLSRFVTFELGHGPATVLPAAKLDSAFSGIVAATDDLDIGYGIGFMVQRRGEFTWQGHNGGVAGYAAMMYFDREHQIGVIVLRNATGGKVRPGKLAVDALKHLIDSKIAADKPNSR